MSQDIAIQVKNLSKKYILKHPVKDADDKLIQEHWALHDVSFEIKKGEAVGIIGPNGSGKSTLLKIMSGVTKPTSGSVEISGRVASILDIGAGFHPELSGRENVFLNGQLLGFSKKEIKDKYHEIIAFSGIERFIEEPVKNYSNGMYLRLAFSILAHLDFDIYLFDEVMSVGDAEFNLKCEIILKKIINDKKTIIIVSHNINEVIKNCKSFMVIEFGQIFRKDFNLEIVNEYVEKCVKYSHDVTIVKHFDSYSVPEDLNIHSVELVNMNKHNSENHDVFFREDKFKFILEFTNINKYNSYDISISIENILGNIILTSSPIGSNILYKENDIGTYSLECIFPNDLFNEGHLFFNVNFIRNKKEVVLNLSKVLSLTIKSNKKYDHFSSALTEYKCLIAPNLTWSGYKKI
jgi:lipopolysaccharide transport system ATP-binding protein